MEEVRELTDEEIDNIEKNYMAKEKRKQIYAEKEKRMLARICSLEKGNKEVIAGISEIKDEIESSKVAEIKEPTFDEIIDEMCKIRQNKEMFERNSIGYQAESIMTGFRLWLFAKCPVMDSNGLIDMEKMKAKLLDPNLFKKYCDLEKPKFEGNDFWIKKYIAEVYFGYKYTFDYSTNKWSAEKV